MRKIKNLTNNFTLDCAVLISNQIDLILAKETKVLKDDDIENLHDMRVDSQRLRACFRLLPPLTGKKKHRELVSETRWLARSLGSVRDFDVALENLKKIRGQAKANNLKKGVDWILEVLQKERKERFEKLTSNLKSVRYTEYKSKVMELKAICQRIMESAPDSSGYIPQKQRVTTQLPRTLDRLISDYIKRRGVLSGYFDPESIHGLRLMGKRFRYMIDFFRDYRTSLFGSTRRILKRVHDTTGSMHDIDVLIPLLEARFADLHVTDPQRAKAARPGFTWLTRNLSSQRRQLMQHFMRQWTEINSPAFEARCRDLAEPWTFRPPRKPRTAVPAKPAPPAPESVPVTVPPTDKPQNS